MYLIRSDFFPTIQDINLTQIEAGNALALSRAMIAAQAEAISFLRQKYDVEKEFTETITWVQADPYNVADRVYLNASAYVSTTAYVIMDLTLHSGIVYRANASTTGAFDPTKWDQLGQQYDLFFAANPYPLFNLSKVYRISDSVYWAGHTYTCKVDSAVNGHDAVLNAGTYDNVGPINQFPDSLNQSQWTDNGAYSVPANADILNEIYWTPGDNRDTQMVQKIVAITLFHLHKRIAPRNVPTHVIDAYKGDPNDIIVNNGGEAIYPVYSALGFLQSIARGKTSASIPIIQPVQGGRVRWGGNVQNINQY